MFAKAIVVEVRRLEFGLYVILQCSLYCRVRCFAGYVALLEGTVG